MHGDADVAAIAAVMGHPARGRMLCALMGGRALPAGELAQIAGVAAPTASAHLTRLVDAGLVAVERQGRHRYHRLAGHQVAEAVESLAVLAPPRPVRSLRDAGRTCAERMARSCYDHLAGALGVAVTDRLCVSGALDRSSLALRDPDVFDRLGVDVDALTGGRRPVTRSCLDWSERLPHLAGGLGAGVLTALVARGWLVRVPQGRAVLVTPTGSDGLDRVLGLDTAASIPGALQTPTRALRPVAGGRTAA